MTHKIRGSLDVKGLLVNNNIRIDAFTQASMTVTFQDNGGGQPIVTEGSTWAVTFPDATVVTFYFSGNESNVASGQVWAPVGNGTAATIQNFVDAVNKQPPYIPSDSTKALPAGMLTATYIGTGTDFILRAGVNYAGLYGNGITVQTSTSGIALPSGQNFTNGLGASAEIVAPGGGGGVTYVYPANSTLSGNILNPVYVQGSASIVGDLTVHGDLIVEGDLVNSGNNSLTVTGNCIVNGAWNFTNSSQAAAVVLIQGDLVTGPAYGSLTGNQAQVSNPTSTTSFTSTAITYPPQIGGSINVITGTNTGYTGVVTAFNPFNNEFTYSPSISGGLSNSDTFQYTGLVSVPAKMQQAQSPYTTQTINFGSQPDNGGFQFSDGASTSVVLNQDATYRDVETQLASFGPPYSGVRVHGSTAATFFIEFTGPTAYYTFPQLVDAGSTLTNNGSPVTVGYSNFSTTKLTHPNQYQMTVYGNWVCNGGFNGTGFDNSGAPGVSVYVGGDLTVPLLLDGFSDTFFKTAGDQGGSSIGGNGGSLYVGGNIAADKVVFHMAGGHTVTGSFGVRSGNGGSLHCAGNVVALRFNMFGGDHYFAGFTGNGGVFYTYGHCTLGSPAIGGAGIVTAGGNSYNTDTALFQSTPISTGNGGQITIGGNFNVSGGGDNTSTSGGNLNNSVNPANSCGSSGIIYVGGNATCSVMDVRGGSSQDDSSSSWHGAVAGQGAGILVYGNLFSNGSIYAIGGDTSGTQSSGAAGGGGSVQVVGDAYFAGGVYTTGGNNSAQSVNFGGGAISVGGNCHIGGCVMDAGNPLNDGNTNSCNGGSLTVGGNLTGASLTSNGSLGFSGGNGGSVTVSGDCTTILTLNGGMGTVGQGGNGGSANIGGSYRADNFTAKGGSVSTTQPGGLGGIISTRNALVVGGVVDLSGGDTGGGGTGGPAGSFSFVGANIGTLTALDGNNGGSPSYLVTNAIAGAVTIGTLNVPPRADYQLMVGTTNNSTINTTVMSIGAFVSRNTLTNPGPVETAVVADPSQYIFLGNSTTGWKQVKSEAVGTSPILPTPRFKIQEWVEDSSSPVAAIENHSQVYLFQNGASQTLYATVSVPGDYVSGGQVNMRIPFYSPDATGTAYIFATTTLVRNGIDAITSTSNQYTSTNSAISLTSGSVDVPLIITLDLTGSSGNLGGGQAEAGDLLIVALSRGVDTATSDIRVMVYANEVTFQ